MIIGRPRALGALLALLVLVGTPAAGQQAGADNVKKELEALRRSVTAMQKDLQEIKALLQTRPPAGAAPAAAPAENVVIELRDNPSRGQRTAPLTLVEFSDYQCPFCARVNPTLDRIRQTYGDRVKIVFKDFPLPNHAEAPKAAEAARCAGDQNKYWEMHDAMFANQRNLHVPSLKQTARAIGLDGAAFDQCLDSGKWTKAVEEGNALGERMGVNSTPTLYVNGRAVIGAMPFENFKSIIDEELARK
jgi:protein-disulfide isomerase